MDLRNHHCSCRGLVLRERRQLVNVAGVKFWYYNIDDVSFGVPRGSEHLLPLLFAFINDLKRSIVNCEFLIFADDLKLYFKKKNWFSKWLLAFTIWFQFIIDDSCGLEFNISKCRSISVSFRCTDYSYAINDIVFWFADNEITDLKVIESERELNFHAHLDKMCCKALKKS